MIQSITDLSDLSDLSSLERECVNITGRRRPIRNYKKVRMMVKEVFKASYKTVLSREEMIVGMIRYAKIQGEQVHERDYYINLLVDESRFKNGLLDRISKDKQVFYTLRIKKIPSNPWNL